MSLVGRRKGNGAMPAPERNTAAARHLVGVFHYVIQAEAASKQYRAAVGEGRKAVLDQEIEDILRQIEDLAAQVMKTPWLNDGVEGGNPDERTGPQIPGAQGGNTD
jgi:hypothetical protein